MQQNDNTVLASLYEHCANSEPYESVTLTAGEILAILRAAKAAHEYVDAAGRVISGTVALYAEACADEHGTVARDPKGGRQ